MRRLRVLRTAAGTGLLGLAFAARSLAADGSPPTIYKWVDENGIAHYTTNKKRIPRNLRNRIRSVDEVKREQEKAELATAASAGAATAASAGTGDAGSPEVESEELGDQAFREGPLGTQAAPDPEPPTATSPAAAPAAAAAAPVTPQPPPPTLATTPVGGPPSGTDIYAIRDAGDDRGTTAGSPNLAGGDDPLFDPEPSEGASIDPHAAARRNEIDGLIAGLEAELAKDERRLKELISGARLEQGKPAPLYGVPELEELAYRFPKIQAEIAALRAERRALDASR